MAINTDLMITIDSGYDEPKYGVSKTLNNYTLDEIWNSCYCGANFPVHRMSLESTGVGVRYFNVGIKRPYTVGSLIYQWGMCTGCTISTSGEAEQDEYKDDGIYVKTIWLYQSGAFPICFTNFNSVRMVTQMDFTRFKVKMTRSTGQSTGETSPTWGDNKSYATVRSNYFLLDGSDPDNPVWTSSGNIALIAPFQLIKYGDKYALVNALPTSYTANFYGDFYDGVNPLQKELITPYQTTDGTKTFCLFQSLKKTSDSYGEIRWGQSSWAVNYPTMYENYKAYAQNRSSSAGYIQMVIYPTSQDEFQKNIMGFGTYFETDKVYKPIIEGGYVTGYTDDLDTPSELDDYTGSSIHVVPDEKPTPTPPTPSEDAEPEIFGWGGNEVAGMVRYFLLTQAEMENLQNFMSNANWRMDYRNCIISMYVVPNNGSLFSTDTSTTLKFRLSMNEVYDDDSGQYIKPPDKELDTGVTCKPIVGVVNNSSAVIEIPKQNDNFLDYEPYSKYFVYIPFCGVVPLPDYVVGKEIKITIYPDVPTCTCTAVVSSEDRKIATISGSYGSELPITSDGSGLKAMSVINSIGNILIGAGELALGVGTGNIGLSIAGGATMLASGLQADMTMGQAFGYSIGASGDTSFFGAGTRCEYYIAYPQWDNPDAKDDVENTNIYGHTFGFVVNKRGILSDFEGFTVCDNPHVYGFSCTAAEKEEIEMLLRQGIIIHKPSE